MSGYCNAYGAESPGGVGIPYGGLIPATVTVQPECHARAAHRFRWIGECGHEGPVIDLCEWHEGEFSGRAAARFEGGEGSLAELNGRVMEIPWNLRRQVGVCYRCNAEAPECENPDHQLMMRGRPGRCGCRETKVAMRLVSVS